MGARRGAVRDTPLGLPALGVCRDAVGPASALEKLEVAEFVQTFNPLIARGPAIGL